MPKPLIIKLVAKGDIEAVRQLPDYVVNSDFDPYFQVTALMWAVQKANMAMVKLLLSKGADVNAQDREGRTALLFAVRAELLSIAETLIMYMGDLDLQDDGGRTPIMLAASKGHIDVLYMLIDRGATVDAANVSGRTALMYACRDGKLAAVEVLLTKGKSDINRSDVRGRTSLMFAAYCNHFYIVKYLISCGVNFKMTDKDGWGAIDWSNEQDNYGITIQLEEAISKAKGPYFSNNISGVCALFAKGRDLNDLVELVVSKEVRTLKRTMTKVPNPWFEWNVGDEIPPDFVYPPIRRRHYLF